MSSSSIPNDQDRASDETDDAEPLWQRLLYMIGFWFLGNIAFSVSILLGAVQLVVVFMSGSRNDELHGFARRLIDYVKECLTYIAFGQEEKPFPFSPFPAKMVTDTDEIDEVY